MKLPTTFSALVATGLLSGLAAGQTFSLVQDINLTGGGYSSNPDGVTPNRTDSAECTFVQLGGY